MAWSAPESEKVFADVIPLPERLTGGAARALALLDAEPADEAPEAARFAAIAGTPYFRAAAPEDRLRLLYRLTRAEANLAVLLARGRTLQAAAEALGRGITTVRTHLQRIFA